MIKNFLNKLMFPHTCCSDAYIRWLTDNGAHIGKNTRFISPKKCRVDVSRAEYITIGEDCCLSMCTILAHDYSWYVMMRAYHDILPDRGGKVSIGNNCFIGYDAIILKDTYIGDNVIIGAGAVVKGNIPSNTVWAGVPARQICTLDELYKRRQQTRLSDAFYRYEIVNNKHVPTIQDMGLFAFLFLERTEEKWNKYLSGIEFNGIMDNPQLKNEFLNSKPYYDDYDEFIEAYINQKEMCENVDVNNLLK